MILMKKLIILISFCLLCMTTSILVGCNGYENTHYDITYVSTNYEMDNVIMKYSKGDSIENIEPPNTYLYAWYSTTETFSTSSIFASDIIKSVNSNQTVYVRWLGKKVGYIDCYYDGNRVCRALAMFNNKIWKLPTEHEGGIGTISYDTQPQDSSSIVFSQPMSFFCSGYAFDGWYLDEECTKKVKLPMSITNYGNINFYSKKGNPYEYNLNIEYVYKPTAYSSTKHIIDSALKKVKYNTNLNDLLNKLPKSLSDYEIIKKSSLYDPIKINGNELPEGNNGWPFAGDLDIEVLIKPKYDGYFEVESSINTNINGLLFPYETLETYYQESEELANSVRVTKPYGSDISVSYRLRDIEGIKFKNGSHVFGQKYKRTFYNLLPNLKRIDLSEMQYISEIPTGFFYGAEHIEEVYAPNLPNLKTIGGGFLCYNNIKKFNFDFSGVETIGTGFLDCAFSALCDSAVLIDLSNLKSISNSEYSQCGFLAIEQNIKVKVKIGNYINLNSSSFSTQGDSQGHFFQYVTTRSKANIQLYSYDSVAVANKLSSLSNIEVFQYLKE